MKETRSCPGSWQPPLHFVCESAVQDGAFLLLKVQLERQPKEPFVFELSIPLADVIYYISGEDRRQLGFIEEQFSNDLATTNSE